MRAKELVPILAEQFGIEPETGAVIDRSLAEKGLRLRGRGRSWPAMTRDEAIVFLLACLVTEKPTKAADEVMPWVTARAKVNCEPLRLDETERGREELAELQGWEITPTPHSERPEVQLWRLLETHLKGKRDTGREVGLVEYLGVICELISGEFVPPERVKLQVVRSHGRMHLTYTDEDGTALLNDTFCVPSSATRRAVSTKAVITLMSSVDGHALQEILLRTRSPSSLAEVDP